MYTAEGMCVLLNSLFPVHTTTMKRYNHLISSDNKGYASYMFERTYNPDSLPGEVSMTSLLPPFPSLPATSNTMLLFEPVTNRRVSSFQASVVGAFAQTSEGDVTPNIQGDFCDVTGEP